MEERLKQIDEAISDAYEAVKELTPGSEEHARLMDSIKNLEMARAELLKAINEVADKKSQKKFNIASLIFSAIGAIGIPTFGILMQRRTNVDLMEYEKEDVMNHRGWDNNVLKMLFKK